MKKILIISAALTLCVAVAHANIIQATQDGPINDPDTWGGATIPTEGDTDTWDTNTYNINVGNEQFYGGLLQVTGGSQLIGANNLTTVLQAMTFDGGGILHGVPNFSTYDLNGKALTFASGGADFKVTGPNNRGIRFDNAVWEGSGPITFVGDFGFGNRRLIMLPGNTLTGYTGTISVSVIRSQLIIQAETNGSFGVNMDVDTLLHLAVTPEILIFDFLVLGDDIIEPGTYTKDQFTPDQQAFFSGTGTLASIQVLNLAPAPVVPPTLAIQRWNNDQVRISWPSSAADWNLQSATELDDGDFTNSDIPVSVEGDENVAYDTRDEPKQFYRLTK